MKRHYLTILLISLCIPSVFATFQIDDKVEFNGKSYLTSTYPLESLYSDENKKPEVFNEGTHFTSCYRGYVANWAINESKLYLVKLEKEYNKNNDPKLMAWEWREVPIDKVFPSKKYPIFADWFSGTLTLAQNKIEYEYYFKLEVVNGAITKVKKLK